MRRPAAWAASAILAATVIVGCGGGDDGDAFCAKAEELSNETDSADMSEEDVKASIDELVDSAPDDIKDDLEVLQGALDDPTSADAEALEEATSNLDAYAQDECDIDLNG